MARFHRFLATHRLPLQASSTIYTCSTGALACDASCCTGSHVTSCFGVSLSGGQKSSPESIAIVRSCPLEYSTEARSSSASFWIALQVVFSPFLPQDDENKLFLVMYQHGNSIWAGPPSSEVLHLMSTAADDAIVFAALSSKPSSLVCVFVGSRPAGWAALDVMVFS